MTVELGVLIAIIGGAMSVATFFIGRQTAAKSDGHKDGRLESDIRHIKDSVDELKHDVKEANIPHLKSTVDTHTKEIEGLKESLRRVHSRIDNISGSIPAD